MLLLTSREATLRLIQTEFLIMYRPLLSSHMLYKGSIPRDSIR